MSRNCGSCYRKKKIVYFLVNLLPKISGVEKKIEGNLFGGYFDTAIFGDFRVSRIQRRFRPWELHYC